MFTIILPVVAAGFVAVFQFNKRKAVKEGKLVKVQHERSLWENARYYLIEFDGELARSSSLIPVIGVFLLCAGLSLFLLPFNLAGSAKDQWETAHIIVMLVLGVVLLVAFGVVERWFTPKPFIPFKLLTNRTVIGACLLNVSWQIAYYCWYSYYSSYLMVVYDLSISRAGYITAIYDVVAGVWLLPVGYLIRKTGQFKWLMIAGLPLYTLGEGLMIHFRKPGYSVGWQAFCQILIAFGGSMFTIAEQVAVLASASHTDAAASLAMLGLFGYFAGAIGGSISAAIWTNTLPEALQRLLPEDTVADWESIYEDIEVQLSYPIGTATRTAIMGAYAEAQRRMLIAGTSVLALAVVAIILVKNIRVDKIEQVKGMLF